ncbi:MAG: hypothetical protein OMM_04036 [Candidatus Magnetoglobus multicellularis str. Araruama]|uniref:Uncharacterized protein n=1 Tax=Candidatus Magnetoglobus multicellularis str. Araruama TaxID=890399 RepID=A0A1V1P397_9BACT|nr:MAG: hypothetical protein OMM_04036 [Candidatus Magnetoglobus multicellularis str. Araruama]
MQATDTNQNSERIVRQVTVKKSKILLLAADEIKETQHILADTGMFNISDIDIMERPSSICLEDLMPYSSILVWTNYPFSNPVNIGNVLIHVSAQDNGGTSHNGIHISQTRILTITILPVNDAPSFVKGKDQLILEDAPKQTIPGWATQISSGTNENQQQVFLVTTDHDKFRTC